MPHPRARRGVSRYSNGGEGWEAVRSNGPMIYKGSRMPPEKLRPFSDAENGTIHEMRAKGHIWRDIASHLGRSASAIRDQAVKALGIAPDAMRHVSDASPLHRHRKTIERLHLVGATPSDIAEAIEESDPAAGVTEQAVSEAIEGWKLARAPLPAGHAVTWGAITAGTMDEGSAYLRH
jgi:hypothetical protein